MLDACTDNSVYESVSAYIRLMLGFSPVLGTIAVTLGLWKIYTCQLRQSKISISVGILGVILGSVLILIESFFIPIANTFVDPQVVAKSSVLLTGKVLAPELAVKIEGQNCAEHWWANIQLYIQAVGIFGLLRGLWHLQYITTESPKFDAFKCGIMIIGGVFCINHEYLLDIFANTFGIKEGVRFWKHQIVY